ncbi:DUF11 domain-containing protein [Streptomyces sp. LS1784]|uniref:DUF11 domain-containing protein n=1 Tax=Streptomyces sp. LS1784 TaxID=2851533 RepID=UPI001CCF49B3|nr:DUF11 domain-containing protein [Streptomyces sp. LS1784]
MPQTDTPSPRETPAKEGLSCRASAGRRHTTTPDSLHAHVTELGLGQVQVIDTTSNTITDTGPFGIAITPVPAGPALTITKTHTGNFIPGRTDTYTITVGNNGTAPTNVTTVTMKDTLPAGLTATSITGRGWRCVQRTLTCTRSDVLNPGNTYPPHHAARPRRPHRHRHRHRPHHHRPLRRPPPPVTTPPPATGPYGRHS